MILVGMAIGYPDMDEVGMFNCAPQKRPVSDIAEFLVTMFRSVGEISSNESILHTMNRTLGPQDSSTALHFAQGEA
ncbi:hypothetical protein CPB85DRAFT_204180 [Mucidula mucida]|nr:hypothetical protein CPB85DRAFT_204180 [Mucidula mucida]